MSFLSTQKRNAKKTIKIQKNIGQVLSLDDEMNEEEKFVAETHPARSEIGSTNFSAIDATFNRQK
jgi:hypothetical protein